MPLQIAWVVHTASALAPLCSWHSTSVSVAVQSSAAREFMPCRVFASTKGKEVEQSDGWSLVCSFMPLWNNKHLSVVEVSDLFLLPHLEIELTGTTTAISEIFTHDIFLFNYSKCYLNYWLEFQIHPVWVIFCTTVSDYTLMHIIAT